MMSGKSLEDDLLKKNMILVMVLMSGKGLEDDLWKKNMILVMVLDVW